MGTAGNATHREPWNKGKIVGQSEGCKGTEIRFDVGSNSGARISSCKADHEFNELSCFQS